MPLKVIRLPLVVFRTKLLPIIIGITTETGHLGKELWIFLP